MTENNAGARDPFAHYAGISGAVDPTTFTETRLYDDGVLGIISGGGMMVANKGMNFEIALTDPAIRCTSVKCLGDSNGWTERIPGQLPLERHTDGSWALEFRNPANLNPGNSSQSDERCFNMVSIRYSPNQEPFANQLFPGMGSNQGANNPLSSLHTGGVQILLSDGSSSIHFQQHAS